MYEHHHEPLLPKGAFLKRQAVHASVAIALVGGSLLIGIVGYRTAGELSWIDSFVNASMILGGMGPVDALHTPSGKLFASCYALLSGFLFLAAAGVLVAPIIHRFLHRFHLDIGEG